jgi:hypothetical protein
MIDTINSINYEGTAACVRCGGSATVRIIGLGTACVLCFCACDERAHQLVRHAVEGGGESDDALQREQFRLAIILYRHLSGPLQEDTTMSATIKIPLEDIRKTEDEIRERLEAMSPLGQATAYLYLNASGMTLDKARDIRRKAGAIN